MMELKACPFCASPAELIKPGGPTSMTSKVICTGFKDICPVNAETLYHDFPHDAEEAWNTRRAQGSDSALRTAVEKMQKLLKESRTYVEEWADKKPTKGDMNSPVYEAIVLLEEIDRALSTSPLPDTGWLPIESAPRDSTAILIGWWHNKNWWQCEVVTFNYREDDGRLMWSPEEGPSIVATHWRPLPQPPATEETVEAANDNRVKLVAA